MGRMMHWRDDSICHFSANKLVKKFETRSKDSFGSIEYYRSSTKLWGGSNLRVIY